MKGLPKKNNWNSFWKDNNNSRFVKKSWSKIRIMKLLDGITEKNMRILDAGSGSGFFSNYFISKKCDLYALDYSEEALKITERNTDGNAKEYLKEDLLDLELGVKYRNHFDIIF